MIPHLQEEEGGERLLTTTATIATIATIATTANNNYCLP